MRALGRGAAIFLLAACVLNQAYSAPAAKQRGVLVRPAVLYVGPDAASAKMENLERATEVVVLDHSAPWVEVMASIAQPFSEQPREVSGWVLDKGIVTVSTPNGDQLLYGAAVEAENEASRRRGRKGAAMDAQRLYGRTAEYFPASPLAPEAAYRAADVRWQIDSADAASRASARGHDPRDRLPIEEEPMRQVIKKFPRTKWADLAAYRLIENKLCGDWEQQPKCPAKEAELYEKYAGQHPQSPAAAEALYNAAWRCAALIELYQGEGESGKAEASANRAIALAQKAIASNASADWNSRAQLLIYMVQSHVPAYGNKLE